MTLDDIIKGVTKALEPKFERIEQHFAAVKENQEKLRSEVLGLKIEMMSIKAQLLKQEKMIMDTIEDTGKNITELEERVVKLERLQQTS